MAGGKGTRFGQKLEKPLAIFNGESLLKRIIKATKESKKITETYVVVTSYTPKTAKESKKASVKVIETDGKGYHADLKQAVQKEKISSPVLILSSDLPFLNGKFLDEIITKYEDSGKPALTVLVPIDIIQKYDLSAVSLYSYEDMKYAVSGINVIDGKKILEEQQQEVIVSTSPEAVFSVNSLRDLEIAKKYLDNTLGKNKNID